MYGQLRSAIGQCGKNHSECFFYLVIKTYKHLREAALSYLTIYRIVINSLIYALKLETLSLLCSRHTHEKRQPMSNSQDVDEYDHNGILKSYCRLHRECPKIPPTFCELTLHTFFLTDIDRNRFHMYTI